MKSLARKRVRPEDARRNNLALVLQALYDGPERSRADLARESGLTKVTVSDLVNELMRDGFLIERGAAGDGRPGRRSTNLAFNPDARDIVALDLSFPDRFRGAVVSPRGEILFSRDVVLEGARGEEAIAAAIALARELVGAAPHPVLGVGVATPGIVDDSGSVVRASNLEWRDVALAEQLTAELGLPVRVENDAKAAAVAERRFAGMPDDLVRVNLSRGVGAGLLVGGLLVRGAAGDAGEIGHVVVHEHGGRCRCGKAGCLETKVAVPALTARIAADPGLAPEILAEAGRWLGTALAPVVGMLGVQHLIIGGPDDLVTADLLDATHAFITDRTHAEFRPELHVTASSLAQKAALLGVAALVLRDELGIR